MALKDYKYEVDPTLIALVRLLQSSDLEGTAKPYGNPPTGAVTHDFHVLLSRNANQFGIRPRSCVWEATIPIPNSTRRLTTRVEFPVLSIASYNSIVTETVNRSNFTFNGLTYYAKKLKQQDFI